MRYLRIMWSECTIASIYFKTTARFLKIASSFLLLPSYPSLCWYTLSWTGAPKHFNSFLKKGHFAWFMCSLASFTQWKNCSRCRMYISIFLLMTIMFIKISERKWCKLRSDDLVMAPIHHLLIVILKDAFSCFSCHILWRISE